MQKSLLTTRRIKPPKYLTMLIIGIPLEKPYNVSVRLRIYSPFYDLASSAKSLIVLRTNIRCDRMTQFMQHWATLLKNIWKKFPKFNWLWSRKSVAYKGLRWNLRINALSDIWMFNGDKLFSTMSSIFVHDSRGAVEFMFIFKLLSMSTICPYKMADSEIHILSPRSACVSQPSTISKSSMPSSQRSFRWLWISIFCGVLQSYSGYRPLFDKIFHTFCFALTKHQNIIFHKNSNNVFPRLEECKKTYLNKTWRAKFLCRLMLSHSGMYFLF